MTMYEAEVLEQYNLKQAKYVYIGITNEKYLSNRSNKWFDKYKFDRAGMNKECKIFLGNLENFYVNELGMTKKEASKKIKDNISIVAYCKDEEVARHVEKLYTGKYVHRTTLNDLVDQTSTIVLSTKDTYIKPIATCGATKLKLNK